MVVLRATQKVLRLLPAPGTNPGASDTALGDWYVNRIVIAHQPLLLIVSATSLLAIIEPARDVRALPLRLPRIVAARLKRLGIEGAVVAAEFAAMSGVLVAKTTDRSVTGQMVDFALRLPYWLPENACSARDLHVAEDRLAEMPCRASGTSEKVIIPLETAVDLLASTWSGKGVLH
jgi:hypothetical protein